MKTGKTGIIRRVDDLGRIVIPKEIRRELKIKDGDPLEIIKTDKGVLFIPYVPYGEKEWNRAEKMMIPILGEFCILDCYGHCRKAHGMDPVDKEIALASDDLEVHFVGPADDPYAYFVVKNTHNGHDVYIAHCVLETFLEEEC